MPVPMGHSLIKAICLMTVYLQRLYDDPSAIAHVLRPHASSAVLVLTLSSLHVYTYPT